MARFPGDVLREVYPKELRAREGVGINRDIDLSRRIGVLGVVPRVSAPIHGLLTHGLRAAIWGVARVRLAEAHRGS